MGNFIHKRIYVLSMYTMNGHPLLLPLSCPGRHTSPHKGSCEHLYLKVYSKIFKATINSQSSHAACHSYIACCLFQMLFFHMMTKVLDDHVEAMKVSSKTLRLDVCRFDRSQCWAAKVLPSVPRRRPQLFVWDVVMSFSENSMKLGVLQHILIYTIYSILYVSTSI